MHIQLLSLFFSNIVLDHVRFAIIQAQQRRMGADATALTSAVQIGFTELYHGMSYGMNGILDGQGQLGELSATQRLFGVGVGRILALANILRHGNNAIAFFLG